MLQIDFGADIAQMFAHPHPMLMFPQEFATNDVAILGHNAHEPVVVFGMVPHELGEALYLPLQPFQPPHHFHHRIRGFDLGLDDRLTGILFLHVRSFALSPTGCRSRTLNRSIVRDRVEVNHSASFLFIRRPATIGPSMAKIFTMVLAGGKGERLNPLTEQRAKPAVPFGGKYRIIDFTLSNCLNSGLRQIAVLIQYKSHSLDRHIRIGWNILNAELGEYITSVPPQQRISEDWYRGTADAVFQNLFLLDPEQPEYLLVLAGDHIYKMNYADMYNLMQEKQADAVVGAIETPLADANRFGVIGVDEDHRILSFDEKPDKPMAIPGDPAHAYVSMGIYLFRTEVVREQLIRDAKEGTKHDFGRNIIPRMIKENRVYAFKFQDENKKAVKYWRDIGTLDAYWEANMDLVAVDPLFNLYDKAWPIRTYQGQFPPAKFVFAQDFQGGRMGVALDSIVCGGCIISGGRVQNSVLSPHVRVHDHADVRESVVMENVVIGEHARIRRAIIDKDVIIPPKTVIGFDPVADRQRFKVTDSGLVVISKGMKLHAAVDSSG
jgi:glucose-1-phosphate adenylyltransferase